MEKIRIITVLCILALAAFALSGCTTFNNFKEAFIDDPEDDGSNEYTRRITQALVKDGELIWQDGQWVQGWPDRRLRVAVPEFAATAKENSAGDPNPLYGYNNTDRLVSNDIPLRDCTVNGLEIEAAENDGHLIVDTQTHFIYGSSA